MTGDILSKEEIRPYSINGDLLSTAFRLLQAGKEDLAEPLIQRINLLASTVAIFRNTLSATLKSHTDLGKCYMKSNPAKALPHFQFAAICGAKDIAPLIQQCEGKRGPAFH